MNILTLRKRAYRKASVNSSDYSNADLLEDFNQAYYQLAVLLANLDEDYFEEQNDKFNLLGNSALYSLPTDTIAVKGIRLAYSTPSSPSDYKMASPYNPTDVHDVGIDEENIPVSNPIYDITNNYFRIKPTPTADVTDGGKIWYIAMPSALANTGDVPILPIQYHDKLSVYGAMQMAFKNEKWQKHARLQAEWDKTVTELEEQLADRDRNKPVQFKSPFEVGRQNNRNVREL